MAQAQPSDATTPTNVEAGEAEKGVENLVVVEKPSPTADPSAEKSVEVVNDWHGVLVVALCWGGVLTTFTSCIASICVAGEPFSPSPSLNTLPLACIFFSLGLGHVILPFKIRSFGRRRAYHIGCIIGCIGCLVVTLGCVVESFVVICLGACFQGLAVADAQTYRFAAMLLAPGAKEKATGRVLLGGVLGAFLGPGAVTRARSVFDKDFAGIFVICAVVHLIVFSLLCFVRFPDAAKPLEGAVVVKPRRLSQILAQPLCVAGMLGTSMSYIIMMLVMAPTPLVMRKLGGHSFNDSSAVMMAHVVLMFLPSIGTPKLIMRFGPVKVAGLGCFLGVLCGVFNLAGLALWNFFVALALLGVFWNFLFLASTAQLVKTFEPCEGPKVVAINDGVASLLTGISTLLSVPIIDAIGWNGDNILVMALSVITAVVISCLWLLSKRSQPQPEKQSESV